VTGAGNDRSGADADAGASPSDALPRSLTRRMGRHGAVQRRRMLRTARQASAPLVLAQAGLAGTTSGRATYAEAVRDPFVDGTSGGAAHHEEA